MVLLGLRTRRRGEHARICPPFHRRQAIHAVLGGLHLFTASSERMEKTIAAFRRLDIHGWPRLTAPACPPWPNCGPRSRPAAPHARWAQAGPSKDRDSNIT